MGALNIVTEGEERVRAKGYALHLVQPCSLLFSGKYRRFYLEGLLPCALSQHIHVLVTDVNVNGIVTIRSLNSVYKLQVQYLRRLTKELVVSLLSGQSGTVNTGLLTGADTDGLSVLYIADRVGLRIF